MLNSGNVWHRTQVYRLPKLLIASMFAALVAVLSFATSSMVAAETQVAVTPYENLSTTSPTTVTVSASGLTPNTTVLIRQVAVNYVEEPGFTGFRVEQRHKAAVTTSSEGSFSVPVSVQYDVRTDLTFADFCQNDTILRRLCHLHLQYQDNITNEVIGQPKLYFGVAAPVIDTTAPTVTIATPADEAVYQQNSEVPVEYGCVDSPNVANIATCEGDSLNGSLLDTSTPGVFTFTVNSTDRAGNSASVTHTYTIEAAVPISKDECFNNGWQTFGSMFENQGKCVAFVAGNGRSSH